MRELQPGSLLVKDAVIYFHGRVMGVIGVTLVCTGDPIVAIRIDLLPAKPEIPVDETWRFPADELVRNLLEPGSIGLISEHYGVVHTPTRLVGDPPMLVIDATADGVRGHLDFEVH